MNNKTKCCEYGWWFKQRGSTVRVTTGAFAGWEGRVNAVTSDQAMVAMPYSGRERGRKYCGTIWVLLSDLEVVDA